MPSRPPDSRRPAEDYDAAYGKHAALFGSQPETSLRNHAKLLPQGLPVLDVGAGQGRNAAYLAQQGIEVVAIDPSAVAVTALRELAASESWPLTALEQDDRTHDVDDQRYGGVLVFGLLPLLRRARMRDLRARVDGWLAPGGLVWITGFTVDDPAYYRWRSEGEELEPGVFERASGDVRSFLRRGELLELYEEYDSVHYWEGLGPEHRHGDGPPERHAWAEGVFRRV